MRSTTALCAALLGLFGCSEGRRFDLNGTWSGGALAADHSGREVLSLRQAGDTISGLACRISSGHRVFYDVPVSGTYPTFTFAYFGDTVTGWAAEEDLLVASRTGSTSYELRFQRAGSSAYEDCRNAPP